MKRSFASKSFVTIIGGAICILILFFAYKYRVNQKIQLTTVPFAAKKLDARHEISADDIETRSVAASMLSENTITNKNNIIGKYVNYNTYIPAGSLFYASQLVEWKDMPDSAWSDIEKGNTIVYIPADSATAGSFIYPGDKIDLYYKTTDPDTNKLVYGKLIQGITVLAVKDSSGNHIFEKSATQKDFSTLIFSVPEDLHLLLRKASYQNGDIVPVARNKSYNPAGGASITSDYLKKLILKNTITVPLDKVETKIDDVGNISEE